MITISETAAGVEVREETRNPGKVIRYAPERWSGLLLDIAAGNERDEWYRDTAFRRYHWATGGVDLELTEEDFFGFLDAWGPVAVDPEEKTDA